MFAYSIFIAFLVLISQSEGFYWFMDGLSRNVEFMESYRQNSSMKHNITDRWFQQKLTHFEPADGRTWEQRYFVNSAHYKKGGPIFLWIGGESPADPRWLQDGLMAELASKYHALMFMVEHRFYGKSRPTKDLSLDSLEFLSSKQALADLAAFRTRMGREWNISDAKWIAFGGSYSGNLAAWMRMKYPHLIYAAHASSAPVKAELNFEEYLDVVSNVIRNIPSNGEECWETIFMATLTMDKSMEYPRGKEFIKDIFRICPDQSLNQTSNLNLFHWRLAGFFMGPIQYGNTKKLERICQLLENKAIGSAFIYRYANGLTLLREAASLENNEKITCFDVSFDGRVSSLSDTNWKDGLEGIDRPWQWQKCTEFGYFKTTDSPQQPFGKHVSLNNFFTTCKVVFGIDVSKRKMQRRIDSTNTEFGEEDIKVSRVIFVNGSMDPWHALGIIKEGVNSTYDVIFINGTSHCSDMHASRDSDPPELTQAREKITAIFEKWINE